MTDIVDRVEVDPKIMAGKPVVKGTRIPVYVVLQMLEDGASTEEVLDAYPDLEEEDVKACLRYATKRMQGEKVIDSESVA
jgi:uncharacterized protein (DUF433 family)